MKYAKGGVACILVAGLLAGASGCGGEKGVPREEHPVVKGTTVEKVESTVIPARFAATGTVRARNSAVLSARIQGTVSRILVKEGDRVQRGELLASLEATESTAGAAGAAYAVDEAKRAVDEALTRKKLADITFNRYAKLYSEQAATRQEYDTQKAERDMAEQGLSRARAKLAQAREAARSAGAIAGYTRIVSPLSGVVSGKSVDVGATVFPGTPLLTVEEQGHYRLEANAPESLMDNIRVGQEIPVFLDGIDGKYTGRVAEIVPKVDPVSRTFTVKLDIPPKGVRSGQFGRAYLPIGEKKGITIPASAVVVRGQLTSVWAVDSKGIARMRLVKPGETNGNRVEILAGLSDGDRIVTGGTEKVTDGARIE
ncbi:MAG TPA: efflux RND transporter periplasmic adaptor subunit [Geobacteraceae bacterium]|nr:efflux RND transporter periplasmic adaptor subunit [Geobacteraceae bacterium]